MAAGRAPVRAEHEGTRSRITSGVSAAIPEDDNHGHHLSHAPRVRPYLRRPARHLPVPDDHRRHHRGRCRRHQPRHRDRHRPSRPGRAHLLVGGDDRVQQHARASDSRLRDPPKPVDIPAWDLPRAGRGPRSLGVCERERRSHHRRHHADGLHRGHQPQWTGGHDPVGAEGCTSPSTTAGLLAWTTRPCGSRGPTASSRTTA